MTDNRAPAVAPGTADFKHTQIIGKAGRFAHWTRLAVALKRQSIGPPSLVVDRV